MRTVSVLASGLLLVATLSGCADDPAPEVLDTALCPPTKDTGEGDSFSDVPVPPTFRLTDQSWGVFGTLTGTGPRDTALFVEAGESCGE